LLSLCYVTIFTVEEDIYRERERERESLFTKYIYITYTYQYYYNGRLPVKALAHRSWLPITENIIHIY